MSRQLSATPRVDQDPRSGIAESGILQTCSSTLRNEGLMAFWKGIPFAYGREGSYTAIRLGAYAPVRDAIGAGSPNAPLYLKFAAGALMGGVGSIAGSLSGRSSFIPLLVFVKTVVVES
jgi:hypothetical protein